MDRLQSPTNQRTQPCSPDGGKESFREPMCVLHMRVPVSVRRKAKLAALVSGVSFREYVAHLLAHAQPLDTARTEQEDMTFNSSDNS
jgi:hypothetical protein